MTDEMKLYKIINYGTQDQIDDILNYIYDKYKPLVIFIASKYLSDDDDIKDVVQETFVEFFSEKQKRHNNIKSYLSIACKHNALDLLKKKKRIYLMSDEESNMIIDNQVISHRTYNEIIDDLKSHLTEEEVKIIYFHLVDNLNFIDISKKIKQNVNTVKSIYYRALKKYKKVKGIKKNEKERN